MDHGPWIIEIKVSSDTITGTDKQKSAVHKCIVKLEKTVSLNVYKRLRKFRQVFTLEIVNRFVPAESY